MLVLELAPQNRILVQVAELYYPGDDALYEAIWLD